MSTSADIMTQQVTSIRETALLSEAVRVLQELDVRHLPVVNGAAEVVGILSDRDLGRLEARPKALKRPVSEAMSADVLTVDLETEVDEIIDLLTENRVGAVPVLDADHKLAGVISYIDVLRQVGREHREARASDGP